MKKPRSKKEVIVIIYDNKNIVFYASSKAMAKIREFGSIRGYTGGSQTLTVSQRYDFDEVLKYLRNYG